MGIPSVASLSKIYGEDEARMLDFLVKSIKEYNQNLVMITHDSGAAVYADGVLTIEDGIIVRHRVV